MPDIAVERVPKIYFLSKALEAAPPSLRIAKDNKLSFISLVKWIRRNRPDLYENLLKAYGCQDDSCLAKGMSLVFLNLMVSHISFQGRVEKVGDVNGVLREWVSRLYPILRV